MSRSARRFGPTTAASARELDAAGLTDPALRAAFDRARQLHARHGRSYFLATRLLPPARRPYVHALYGFARAVDDLVDDRPPGSTERIDVELRRLRAALTDPQSTEPAVAAVRETIRRFDLPVEHLGDFLAAMRTDLSVTGYATYAELERYMWGSGAVIGLLLLPILGTTGPVEIAAPYAADLGVAFQLTNFLRDVGEDLARGRIYLPAQELAAFGVQPDRLRAGIVDEPLRDLLRFQIARTRAIYGVAAQGVRLLEPASRPCIRAALRLYAGILDAIERADYQVLDRRVRVSGWRRVRIAAPAVVARAAAAG